MELQTKYENMSRVTSGLDVRLTNFCLRV